MWFQPEVEIGRADAGIDDGQDDENDGDDGKGRQGLSDRSVLFPLGGLVHPHELEDEVGHAGYVQALLLLF